MIEQNRIHLRLLFGGILTLLIAGPASSDVITLKTGEVIRCTFLGGTSRTIRVEAGGVVKTYDLGQIATVSFLDGDSAAPATGLRPPTPTNTRTVIPANTS